MIYTIYDPTSGKIISTVQSSDQQDIDLTGKTSIEGYYSPTQYKIIDGHPVEITAAAASTRDWAAAAREIRDQQLAHVDRVNPIWYASLTAEQQTELAQYRQALLDVPQQESFPGNISWPTKPIWL
jgi:hypothetical protein